MSNEFSRGRRFVSAFLALAFAAVLFRAQIAQALVIRGDEYLYRGLQPQALERYRRALLVAPFSETAVDRYVFVRIEEGTQQSLNRGITVAGRYLNAHPNDPAILADRALCYLHVHRYASAQRDFIRAARASHSVGDYVFAGWAAQRAGHHAVAIALWTQALRIAPDYRPASIALAEHGR